MALGKKRIVIQKSYSMNSPNVDVGGLLLDLEFVQYKRGFGRKRILISSGDEIGDSIFTPPIGKPKKLCDKSLLADRKTQQLEDLPQDILVRIICGVEHEDLKQLFHVSKTIRDATLMAKKSHFAYNTPRKTSVSHHGRLGDDNGDDDEVEAPGAPLQKRYRHSRINRDKDDYGVSMALFN